MSLSLIRILFRVLGVVAPQLAAALAYRLWFSSPRFAEPEREQHWRAQAELTYLQDEGKRFAAYRWGPAGQPLIYVVHGWSGRAAQFGAFVNSLNEHGYTVIGFDAPGHGLSAGTSTNIFEITSALYHLIKTYGAPSHIIAHSFGSMVSALLIRKYGIQPKSLISISSPTDPEYLLASFAHSLQISEKVMRLFRKKIKQNFGEQVYRQISAEYNLQGNEIPALIVHDKNDPVVDWQYSQRLHDVMPNARLMYTEKLGHSRILRNKKVISEIVTFISGNEHERR